MASRRDERNRCCTGARHNRLVLGRGASTVVRVRPFRLLKISLVAAVVILLSAAATRDPGEVQVPMPRFVEDVVEQFLDRMLDRVQ